MFWGVVTMVDAGVVETVVSVEEADESVFVSAVDCWLLLHDANENRTAASSELEMVRAEIIVIVFKY